MKTFAKRITPFDITAQYCLQKNAPKRSWLSANRKWLYLEDDETNRYGYRDIAKYRVVKIHETMYALRIVGTRYYLQPEVL